MEKDHLDRLGHRVLVALPCFDVWRRTVALNFGLKSEVLITTAIRLHGPSRIGGIPTNQTTDERASLGSHAAEDNKDFDQNTVTDCAKTQIITWTTKVRESNEVAYFKNSYSLVHSPIPDLEFPPHHPRPR